MRISRGLPFNACVNARACTSVREVFDKPLILPTIADSTRGWPPTNATSTLHAHTGPDRIGWSPDRPPRAPALRTRRQSCGRSPAGGRQQPGQTTLAHRRKAPCSPGDREPARSTRPDSGPWRLTRAARARLIQPRHWQASWQSGPKPALQHRPCRVLPPRSGPWRTSSGCPQQSPPCTNGLRREPHPRALSPICPEQAWSSWSKRPEAPDTERCSAHWPSSAGYATCGWAKQLASGLLTWLCQALSSFGTPKQGRRGIPPAPCTGMRTASGRGFMATWFRWADPQTCSSGSQGKRGWRQAWPRPWRAPPTPEQGGTPCAGEAPQRLGP